MEAGLKTPCASGSRFLAGAFTVQSWPGRASMHPACFSSGRSLRRVCLTRDLEDEVTGEESRDDVETFVDEILDELRGETEEEDSEDEWDDENEEEDEEGEEDEED
jgi:hypothetical protein